MHFLTGFPGFLGTEYIKRRLAEPKVSFLCLVQEKYLDLARAKRDEMEKEIPGALDRIQFVLGDLTSPGLGLASDFSKDQIEEVEHFAAVYDLNVSLSLGTKINVEGTKRVLEFCDTLPKLLRLHYVSTCYVSGRYNGVFKESDLELGQKFNNFYESTKYEAERLVREKMKSGMPVTIYRPSIVVGNSITGETQKFDGPYFVIQWLLRQKKFALLPKLGDPEKYTINLVPSDYVLNAMTYLAKQSNSIGFTFQLADPDPLTISKIVHLFAKLCEKKLIEIPLPKALAKTAVGMIPGLENWLGIPKSSLDYFVQPTHYDTSVTVAALNGSGIECPRFESYAARLIEYQKQAPKTRSKALI